MNSRVSFSISTISSISSTVQPPWEMGKGAYRTGGRNGTKIINEKGDRVKDIGYELQFMSLADLENFLEQKELEECKKDSEEFLKNKKVKGE